jgi:hypothetical protein
VDEAVAVVEEARGGHNSFNYEDRGQVGQGRGNNLKQYVRRYDKSQVKCNICQKYGHYAWESRSHTNNVEES